MTWTRRCSSSSALSAGIVTNDLRKAIRFADASGAYGAFKPIGYLFGAHEAAVARLVAEVLPAPERRVARRVVDLEDGLRPRALRLRRREALRPPPDHLAALAG